VKKGVNVAIVLAVLIVYWAVRAGADRFDEIEYQGQKFKLSKAYGDYDDFKNDPNNLAAGQQALIEKAVLAAALPRVCADRDAVIHAAFEVRFPGYGLSSFGEQAQADGSVLNGASVEIPGAAKERVFVYRGVGGEYRLIDDFEADESAGIMGVTLRDGKLEYSRLGGQLVLTRPLGSADALPADSTK
jgi:hypothetical protein